MHSVKMQHPKVVILGAGSLFFGRQAMWRWVPGCPAEPACTARSVGSHHP